MTTEHHLKLLEYRIVKQSHDIDSHYSSTPLSAPCKAPPQFLKVKLSPLLSAWIVHKQAKMADPVFYCSQVPNNLGKTT